VIRAAARPRAPSENTMSNINAPAEHQRIARLPYGYTVTFGYGPDIGLRFEWEPDVPRIRSPRAQRRFFEAYTRERDAFMRDIATMIGGSVMVADVGGPLGSVSVIRPGTRH
jgi:hypothetical protein